MTRRGRIAVPVAAAILLAACGGGGQRTVHTGSSTTVTTPATTGSGGSVNVGIICSTPRDAAVAVLNAWTAGEEGAALRCGAQPAVTTLFARGAGAGSWVVQQCSATTCSFRGPHATVRLTMGGSDAAGWIVTEARFQG